MFVFVLTVAGGVSLLFMSIHPGMLMEVVFSFPGFLFWMPFLFAWALLVFVLAARDLVPPPVGSQPRKKRRWGAWSAFVTALTLCLLFSGAPNWLAFKVSRPFLESLVQNAPSEEEANWKSNGRIAGVHWIDAYYRDPRGGVYFRTHSAMDGISPDRRSYGFAFKPNLEGSPFGDARGWHRRLAGDWYVFSFSNDW